MLFVFYLFLFLSAIFPTAVHASSGTKSVVVIDMRAEKAEAKAVKKLVISNLIEVFFLDENFSPFRDDKKIENAKGKYSFSDDESLKIGRTLKVDLAIYGEVSIKRGEIYVLIHTLDVKTGKEIFRGNMFCVNSSLIPQVAKRLIGELKEKIFWSKVLIKTEPPGANVFIEGVLKGVTPFRGNIPPSTYSIKLEKDGFRVKNDILTILEGESIAKKYKLSRIVYLLSSPSGAKIHVDGQLWGITPTSYYSETSILNITWNKEGYAPVERVIDVSSMRGIRKVRANLIKNESVRFFESGIEKEKEFSELFDSFISSKRGEKSKIFSNFFEGSFSERFKETAYFFQSATLVDPSNGPAYFRLAKLYYEYILVTLGSPIHVKTTLSELMDFAAQSARISVNLETDTKTTLQSMNLLGSILMQRAENRNNSTESLQDLNRAVEKFQRAIKLFDEAAKHDNDLANFISLYDNLHFNRSLCVEEIYKIKKDKGSYDVKKWCSNALKSWNSYDYLNIVNPENPFKPTVNPLKKKAREHINELGCTN